MLSTAKRDFDQPVRRHAMTFGDSSGFAHAGSSTRIRAAVFDVGDVLFLWSLRTLFEKLIDDPRELDWFLTNVVTEEWHFQHDAGRPLAEMVAERKAEFPDHGHLIDAYAARFNESIHAPVPGMQEIIDDLTARGVPVLGITNFGADLWAGFRPTKAIFDQFADIVVSGEEKLMKPDPAIYALSLRRFGLAAGEGIFVDDRNENAEAASQNGFVGHHFTDATTLRTALESHGLL